jgi:hypothetical protein
MKAALDDLAGDDETAVLFHRVLEGKKAFESIVVGDTITAGEDAL